MDLKRIVIATDFSEVSLLAVEAGAQLARESGAELMLVHVMEFPRGANVATKTLYGSVEEQYRQQLHRLQLWLPENLKDKTVAQRIILRGSGTPVRQIADFAQQEDADLIVVGTHGRKGLGRLVMGSTAEGLLRWAPCQVLVVKPKVAAERASLGTDPVEVSEDKRKPQFPSSVDISPSSARGIASLRQWRTPRRGGSDAVVGESLLARADRQRGISPVRCPDR